MWIILLIISFIFIYLVFLQNIQTYGLKQLKHFRGRFDGNFLFKSIFEELRNNKNLVVKIWNGHFLFNFIKSPNVAKKFLSTCSKSKIFNNFMDLNYSILFGSEGDWKVQRKILKPFFKLSAISNLLSKLSVKCDKILIVLNKSVNKEINILNPMSALVIEMNFHNMNYDVDLLTKSENTLNDVTLNLFR